MHNHELLNLLDDLYSAKAMLEDELHDIENRIINAEKELRATDGND